MRKTRLEKEYAYHISWLRKYYIRKQIESMLSDESLNKKDRLKAKIWQKAIDKTIQQTDPKIMRVIKDVYVFKARTLSASGQAILFYGKSKSYLIVRDFFETLDRNFYGVLADV